EHPHLAAVLVLEVARRLLPRLRVAVEHRTPPALHHQVRQREVVPEARIDLDVVGAAHGVDRADAAGDRSELRLTASQPRLEAPVEPLAVRPAGLLVRVAA